MSPVSTVLRQRFDKSFHFSQEILIAVKTALLNQRKGLPCQLNLGGTDLPQQGLNIDQILGSACKDFESQEMTRSGHGHPDTRQNLEHIRADDNFLLHS